MVVIKSVALFSPFLPAVLCVSISSDLMILDLPEGHLKDRFPSFPWCFDPWVPLCLHCLSGRVGDLSMTLRPRVTFAVICNVKPSFHLGLTTNGWSFGHVCYPRVNAVPRPPGRFIYFQGQVRTSSFSTTYFLFPQSSWTDWSSPPVILW